MSVTPFGHCMDNVQTLNRHCTDIEWTLYRPAIDKLVYD